MRKPTKKILIVGEQPLVEEMSTVCTRYRHEPVTSSQYSRTSLLTAFELSNINIAQKKKNLIKLDKSLPLSCFIFSSAVTVTISEQATWLKHPERLLGISALPTLLSNSLIELAVPLQTPSDSVLRAKSLLSTLGKNISVIQDRIGMVTPRVVCMIINEAFFALMEEIASPKDIDLAMKLGTNYPNGPIEWAKKIGFRQVISVLDSMRRDLGEERYRIAPLLRQLGLQFA